MERLEKNFSYMQHDTKIVKGLLKEMQRFFVNLAAEHRIIQQRLKGWPFIKVNPKE